MNVRLRAMEPEDLDLLYHIENDETLWKVGSSNVPYSRYALHNYIASSSYDIYVDRQVRLMAENERFIFQRLNNADGPVGALGVSLTAGRSLAVDSAYIPLGAMLWLDTHNPDGGKIQKIVFAQDIGSAIKGVVRGDYFWGHGEEALYHAGRMNSGGCYYLLAPRQAEVKVD